MQEIKHFKVSSSWAREPKVYEKIQKILTTLIEEGYKIVSTLMFDEMEAHQLIVVVEKDE
jgi:hypothetical protein